MSDEQRATVRGYVRSVAREGVVRETIKTTVLMMGWQV